MNRRLLMMVLGRLWIIRAVQELAAGACPAGAFALLRNAKYDYWQDPVELIYLDSGLEELARKPLTHYQETSR